LLASNLPAMRRLADQVRLAARISVPALLLGEPGVGKRTLARLIHSESDRREQACATLECGYLPAKTLSAVLFGDTTPETIGTLYLAAPEMLPRDLQLRLCEWLAQSAGDRKRPRILAGCDTDIAKAVLEGRLLEELHCALSPLVLEVPPLRERRDDLATL